MITKVLKVSGRNTQGSVCYSTSHSPAHFPPLGSGYLVEAWVQVWGQGCVRAGLEARGPREVWGGS